MQPSRGSQRAPASTSAGAATFGFTDHDRPLRFDSTDFEPESGFAATELRSGSDLAVDAQDAEGVLSSDRRTETDILDGRWDDAEVEVWQVNWNDMGERVLMRRGAVGQIRRGRLAFAAEVRSLAHVLGQTVGRTFQATCDAALGDGRCGVDLAPRHIEAQVRSSPSPVTAGSPPPGSAPSPAAGSRSARSTRPPARVPAAAPRWPGTVAREAR